MSAIDDIAAERQRQVSIEGWTTAHDDQHTNGEMAAAAGCYAIVAGCSDRSRAQFPTLQPYPEWPWDRQWWKPKNRRHDLVRAGALIVAEIERLDRASGLAPDSDNEAVHLRRAILSALDCLHHDDTTGAIEVLQRS